ncbi:unnamed protein product [Echinostoma caproni]|uniref:G_PROTEIN_RECEP_F1_2 domain-containing protein n=1 Tax=Echinostoma caproni TaxID=27848 RepID=A0A183B9R7_9TREM|nr:unnamed protein product [Echinostoma caproni]
MLMYNHNIFNALYGIAANYLLASLNYSFPAEKAYSNPFVCYIIQSGFIIVMLGSAIICNVLCQCADRYRAIFYPRAYRARTKPCIIASYVFIATYATLVSTLRFFQTHMVDGKCFPFGRAGVKHVLALTELVVMYFLPFVLIVTLTVPVLWQLRQLRLGSGRNKRHTSITHQTNTNQIGRTEDGDDIRNSIVVAQRSIFIHTLTLAIEITILEFTIILFLILDNLHVFILGIASPIRIYLLCIKSLYCTFNPFLTILTVTPLRRTVVKHLLTCKSHCTQILCPCFPKATK